MVRPRRQGRGLTGLFGALFTPVVALGAVGCGAAAVTSRTEIVEMEPVRVVARTAPEEEPGEPAVELEAYDARDLLRRGNEALEAERWQQARRSYDRLLEEFPGSSLASAAHYNAALSLEREGQIEGAAERYLQLYREFPDSSDAVDALYQAAGCYERLERWDEVVEVFDIFIEREGLSVDEQIEAMARRGAALVNGGRLEQGERQLRRAIAIHRRLGAEALRTDYYLAQAQYYLGEAPRRAMARVELTNEEAQFRQALERRCELLLEAQTQYVQAIRVGNTTWGAASAYRIGAMYSELYDDVMEVPIPEAEVPPDLTEPEDIEAFRQEYPAHYRRLLREYLEPLLHNAIRWWESNLMMIERTGVRGQWVQRTREELNRVQALLNALGEGGSEGEEGGGEDLSSPAQDEEVTENTDE